MSNKWINLIWYIRIACFGITKIMTNLNVTQFDTKEKDNFQ